MTVSAVQLRQLHRIHRQLADLRERLEQGPKKIAAAEGNVTRQENALLEAQNTVKRAKLASDQKQLQLKVNEDKILDNRARLNSCSTNREYQALMEQIAAAEMANSVLSDEILEMLEKIDGHEAAVEAAKEDVAKSKGDLEKIRSRVEAEREGIEGDIARLEQELSAAEGDLDSEFKVQYERLARLRGDESMAAIEGQSCTGCYVMITPQMYNELTLSLPVFCKSCGRLLYIPEEE